MNNKSIDLAESIAARISRAATKNLSVIEKDILLEDVRNLYRTLLAAETTEVVKNSGFSSNIEPLPVIEPTQLTKEINEPVIETQPKIEEAILKEPEMEVVKEEVSLIVENTFRNEEVAEKEYQKPVNIESFNNEVLISEEVKPQHSFISNIDDTPEPEAASSSSLNEVFKREESSINTMASSAVRELHSVVASTSFSGLLDLNKRILFTKELFNENSDSFHSFVQQLERCNGLDDAKSLVNTTALAKQWKSENETVKLLVKLVRQHFEFK